MGGLTSFPIPSGAKGVIGVSDQLPLRPEQLTAEWFTDILGRKVTTATIVEEIHGTGSKILVSLNYEDPEEGAPKHVCVKGGFNTALLAIHPMLMGVYRLEASFFYYLDPLLNMRTPPSYWCATDAKSGQGIVVMQDLKAAGSTFGDPLVSFPVERVRAGVEQLALLHAKTWGAGAEKYPWLLEAMSLRHVILNMMGPEPWAGRFDGDSRPPVPAHLVDRERMIKAYKCLWNSTDPKFTCVLHGDSHIGNTFVTPAGEPGFLDWQGVHTGSAIHDVAYFIVGSLEIEERRRNEEGIFEHYLEKLHAAGGPKFSKDEAWFEYRKHNLHGFAWALTPPIMQSKERVNIMSARHSAAIEDHNSLELLESLPEYGKEWS